jgi:RNA polymerase sigma factor (sigma-70 family)
MHSDEELMAAYVAGDERAFRALFERYADLLFAVLRRSLPQPEDARDLVQRTFLHLHRARLDYRAGAPVRPWLFTIAMNLKREHFRGRARRPEEPLATEPATSARDPEAIADDSHVRKALASLPDGQREVIALHWFAGLSFGEVAQIVGASLTAVKVRAHRGYGRLRELLGPDAGPAAPSAAVIPIEEKP